MDNVKYCGYCDHHFQKINRKLVKTIPAFKPEPTVEVLSPGTIASPDKPHNAGLKEAVKHLQASSKGKGKRGRKPGSMIYEPKLEPPKFNPDLASLNSSNNSLNSVGNSVTLTPVSSFSNSNHKTGNSFSTNSEAQKNEKIFSDKVNNKAPNVVVKIGKHGEVYHAKKDSPRGPNGAASPIDRPSSTEAILDRVTPVNNLEVKEEVNEKKGFTTANFTESYVTANHVSVTASLLKPESGNGEVDSGTGQVKVECGEPEELSSTEPGEQSQQSLVQSTVSSSGSTSSSEPEHLPNQQNHSVKLTSLESQHTAKPASSGVMSNMFGRTSLNSSVSLFPTNSSVGPLHAKSEPSHSSQSSVSITPSNTSNSSSSLTVSRTESGSPGVVRPLPPSQPVTISPVGLAGPEPDLARLPLESPGAGKGGPLTLASPRSKAKAGPGGAAAKRMGRPPKKGTHTTQSSLGSVIHVESEEEEGGIAKRPRLDPTADRTEDTVKSDTADNGVHKFMMFGATLNPASEMSREMSKVLQVRNNCLLCSKLTFCFSERGCGAFCVLGGRYAGPGGRPSAGAAARGRGFPTGGRPGRASRALRGRDARPRPPAPNLGGAPGAALGAGEQFGSRHQLHVLCFFSCLFFVCDKDCELS